MIKPTALLAIALVGTATAISAAPAAPQLPALEDQVHCALVFAEVTRQQSQSLPGADRFPAMAKPGREFFVRSGARALDEKAATLETLQSYFVERVNKLKDGLAKSPDPAAALDREFSTCLPQFAVVAPEFTPAPR